MISTLIHQIHFKFYKDFQLTITGHSSRRIIFAFLLSFSFLASQGDRVRLSERKKV